MFASPSEAIDESTMDVRLAEAMVVGITNTRVFTSFSEPKIDAISGRASSHCVKEEETAV